MGKTFQCRSCQKEKVVSKFYFRKETGKYKTQCKRCCIDKKRIEKDAENKRCKHCGELKPFAEFQKAGGGKWHQPYCKSCDAKRKKKHRSENYEKIKKKGEEYYARNKEMLSARGKEERRIASANRPKRVFKRMPEGEKKRRKSDQNKAYREANREKVKLAKRQYYERVGLEKAKQRQKQKSQNIEFRILKRLRGRIYVALKRGIKSATTRELLGCSIDEFKSYFEVQFAEGMTWEKYMEGAIHIDHIIPCIKFDLTKEEEQRKCFHYTNLQPLWAVDNLKKATKILSSEHSNNTGDKLHLPFS